MLSLRNYPNIKARTGHPLLVGCTGLYPLREGGAGTGPRDIRDLSGNERHGTFVLTGSHNVYPIWAKGYKDKGGLNFDGFAPSGGDEGSEVRLPGNSVDYIPQAGGTISAWVRPIGTGPTSAIANSLEGIATLSSDSGAGNGLFRGKLAGGTNDRVMAFHRDSGGEDKVTCADLITPDFNENGWYHVIWQFDGTTVLGGVNGKIVNSTASTSTAYLTASVVKIGKGNANNFNGDISDVRFWSRVLAADELRWLYDDPDDIFLPRKALYFFQNHIQRIPHWFHSTAARVEVHADPEIASHCEEAKDKLLQQFKQKVKIEDFVCVFSDQIQNIEQVFADIRAFRSLTTAVGVQLDMLGENLLWPRNDFDDDKYRRFLNAKALAVGSQGHADQLIDILTTLDDGFDLASISYAPSYPAGILMHCMVPQGRQLDGEAYARILKPCAPATVQLILEFEESDVTLFQYEDSDDDPTPDVNSGFEEESSPGTGGILAEAV